MNNSTKKKKPLTERDREFIIDSLDTAYINYTSLSAELHRFDDFAYTIQERNEIILSSLWKHNEKIVSMLTLFGA